MARHKSEKLPHKDKMEKVKMYEELTDIFSIKYMVTDNLYPFVPEIPDEELSETHFVYELGLAIIPPKDIRTGDKIMMSNRVWAQFDTLLTSDTITDAMEISKARNT